MESTEAEAKRFQVKPVVLCWAKTPRHLQH